MSKRSKRHHFVPKVLQKQFLFRDNEIWFSKRAGNGGWNTPELTTREAAFQAPNYYSILDNGELSDVVEAKFYSKIDNYLGNVIPDCIEAFAKGHVPTFEGVALDGIRRVMFEMAKRTPEFMKNHKSDEEIGREIVDAELAHPDCTAERMKEIERELRHSGKLRALGRTVRVRSTIKKMPRAEAELEKLSARWIISRTHHSYVLSSIVAYRIGNGGPNGLSNPKFEMWMPISPKIALVLLRDEDNKYPLVNEDSPSQIRKLNEYAARNSSQIASHSQRLIESIVGRKSRFGELPLADRNGSNSN